MVYGLISGVVYVLEWKLFLLDGITNLKTISQIKILILTDRNISETGQGCHLGSNLSNYRPTMHELVMSGNKL